MLGHLALGMLVGMMAAIHPRNAGPLEFQGLQEVNPPPAPEDDSSWAIVGARLIHGRGEAPIEDGVILIEGNRITAVGPRSEVTVPAGSHVWEARGCSVLPGLIDAHFHNATGEEAAELAGLILSRGVTTVRDPGRPIPDYQPVVEAEEPMPRCFLTGPHFDQRPHAHPQNAVALEAPEAVVEAIDRYVDHGASAIKVYFRLPLELIRVTCEEAHRRGIPVTAHLELVDADDAVRAGLDGIEHVTSLGTALAEPEAAEAFRRDVTAENEARRDGRYRLWADVDLDRSERVEPLLELLRSEGVVLSPTLGIFERREGDDDIEAYHVRGFERMLQAVGLCAENGIPVVVGSHTWVHHAGHGWAFQREMELLVEAGLSPSETIEAATSRNARFLGCFDRLGSLEPGKTADLLVVEGNPLERIEAMRAIRKVMLNGRWVGDAPEASSSRSEAEPN